MLRVPQRSRPTKSLHGYQIYMSIAQWATNAAVINLSASQHILVNFEILLQNKKNKHR